MPEQKFYKKEDVCEILQISKRVLDGIIASRKISYYKIGKGIRFTEEDIESYIKRSHVQCDISSAARTYATPAPAARPSARRVSDYVPGMKVV